MSHPRPGKGAGAKGGTDHPNHAADYKPLRAHPQPANVPAGLRAGRWCVVAYSRRVAGGGNDKAPRSPRSRRPISTKPPLRAWTDYDTAVAALKPGDVLGRLLDPDDGIVCLDLDNVCNPETGELDDFATELIGRFAPCYCEASPSGTGVHVWIRGELPHRINADELQVYDGRSPHYATCTGWTLPCSTDAVREPPPGALEWLYDRYPPSHQTADGDDEPPPLDPNDLPALPELSERARATYDGRFAADDDRSRRVAALARELAACGLSPAAVLGLLVAGSGPWSVALDHRRGDEDKARAYL